jgi:flavodoxin
MKVLIAYYSLSGTTRKLAERMADMLKCDIKRLPILGGHVPVGDDRYDLVIVGGPIWLYSPAFPVGRFLSKNKNRLPEVAFFCTYQTSIGSSFEKMERKGGKKPRGTLSMKAEEIGTESGDQKLKGFLDQLK